MPFDPQWSKGIFIFIKLLYCYGFCQVSRLIHVVP